VVGGRVADVFVVKQLFTPSTIRREPDFLSYVRGKPQESLGSRCGLAVRSSIIYAPCCWGLLHIVGRRGHVTLPTQKVLQLISYYVLITDVVGRRTDPRPISDCRPPEASGSQRRACFMSAGRG